MKTNKKRKEILLDKETIAILEEKAKKQGRNLKNYIEFVLSEKANDILSEPKALEIKSALNRSKAQSRSGQVKNHTDVINAAKKKVNENSVDRAS